MTDLLHFDACDWCKCRLPASEISRIKFAGRVLFVCGACTQALMRSTPTPIPKPKEQA